MTPIERRLSALEQARAPKVRWLPATDDADAKRHRAERAGRGETELVQFIITGVPR